MRHKRLALACVIFSTAIVQAQQRPDLNSLSVEDLMNVEVTSVSRKAQKLLDVPAAVFVITQDDIQRSGATSIPEVLRIVPGLEVARINGSEWAISARGFNRRYANKLLVLIDGRTVYETLDGGVTWDVQDMLLEDVDRIEVIRGPGGTLWGANAANGIINIITKHTVETEGTLLSVGHGNTEGSFLSARHGGSLWGNGNYRAYVKTHDREESSVESGIHVPDGSDLVRVGARADWSTRRGDNFTAQADSYRSGSSGTTTLVDPSHPFAGPIAGLSHFNGSSALFRWSSTQSKRSDTVLQISYDRDFTNETHLGSRQSIFDVDFQHNFKFGSRSNLTWGLEYRGSEDHLSNTNLVMVEPASSNQTLLTAFAQDEFKPSEKLRLTVGSKFLYDKTYHLQLQPSLRLLYRPSESQALWLAATDGVRMPSRFELGGCANLAAFHVSGGRTGLVEIIPLGGLKPEEVRTYEVGYRYQPDPRISIDAAAFRSRLRRVIATSPEPAYTDEKGRRIVPLEFENAIDGKSQGLELFASYSPLRRWNVALGYTLFELDATNIEGTANDYAMQQLNMPRHQLQLRSFLNLTQVIDIATALYYVGPWDTRVSNSGLTHISSYTRLDANLTWHLSRRLDFSVVGQNLGQPHHEEFAGIDTRGAQTTVPRSVYGKVTWRF